MYKINPPKSEKELMTNAYKLAGKTTTEIAKQLNIEVPQNLLHNKGWFGNLIEVFLGATAGSHPTQDFINLEIELKTIPVDEKFYPIETTFVCYAPLIGTSGIKFENSNVYNKLKKVLWVPFLGSKNIPIGSRIIFSPILWTPNFNEINLLKQDWQEHMEKINLGYVESITAHDGEILQIRPKAANGQALTKAIGKDGKIITTRPRGFYLRKKFTQHILNNFYF